MGHIGKRFEVDFGCLEVGFLDAEILRFLGLLGFCLKQRKKGLMLGYCQPFWMEGSSDTKIENSVGSYVSHEISNSSSSHMVNGNNNVFDEDISLEKNSNVSIIRRRKSQKKKKKRIVFTSKYDTPENGNSLILQWFRSLKAATYSLYGAFRQPAILRPMTWFFLAHVTVPNLSTIMFYYQTEFLNLEPSFLGTARVVGWAGLMLGTYAYNCYLKKIKLRKILIYCSRLSRLNVAYWISDKATVLYGSALSDAVNQFKLMPFLILIQGTLFALFMSINNFGSTVGSFVGAGLASILNISSGSFDNLLLGIVIQVICTFIPIAFLFLIPKEATGVST
ncbi:hypothetical protein Dsin_023035 [Dipteronia sinensis]|uniref:Uncharacterized protein n=1 Tax=Dipteronia sinensis TaxID=43782 RepID=A0AAE0A2M2_9ROSI|nr:hypothetical protein Dsin_023035 [Dipteronia sinensis]